jgi:hypothetical protein
MDPGALTLVSKTATTATIGWTDAVDGVGAVSAQLQRRRHSTFSLPPIDVGINMERSVITQRGITWTLSAPAMSGQFVNGDWWVVDSGSGITVSSVSPAPTTIEWIGTSPAAGTKHINGSMKNPVFNTLDAANRQAFDERGGYYLADYLVSYPVALVAGDMLLSTESHGNNNDSRTDVLGGSVSYYHAWLLRGEILTVVDEVPASDMFRPPYIRAAAAWDGTHPVKLFSEVNTTLLKGWTPISATMKFGGISSNPADDPCGVYANFFARPWFLGWNDVSSVVCPTANGSNYYDGPRSAIGEAMCLLHYNYTQRNVLLVPFLQFCLDSYYCATDQKQLDRKVTPSAWVFAGTLFGDTTMRSFASLDSKDETSYYFRSETESLITSTTVPSDEFWEQYLGITGAPADADPAGWRTNPGTEHSHLNPQTMFDVFDIYYDGADDHATIICTGSGTDLTLRTYNASNEVQTTNAFSANTLDGQPMADAINALSAQGWHCSALANTPGVDAPFCRTPRVETNCTGSGNAVTVTMSEWDKLAGGGKKGSRYEEINNEATAGLALPVFHVGASAYYPTAAFIPAAKRWMSLSGSEWAAVIGGVPGMTTPSQPPGTTSSAFITQTYADHPIT